MVNVVNYDEIKSKVYYRELKQMPKYIKNKTEYVSVFNEKEKSRLMEIYSRDTNIFNGVVIRLDKMELQGEMCTFYISKINYFDLLTSNILNYNPEKWFKKVLNKDEEDFCNNMLVKIEDVAKNHSNIENVISNINLSNVIAISVLIKDKNGNFGITKRSKALNISTSFFSTSVTGDVDEKDFETDDHLINCVRREVFEELGIKIDKIKIRGIAISKTKLQPVILFDAEIDEEWEALIKNMTKAKDYNFEVEKFLITSSDKVSNILDSEQFTDATKFHIYLNII